MLLLPRNHAPLPPTVWDSRRVFDDYSTRPENLLIGATGQYDVNVGVAGGEWRILHVPGLGQRALVSQSPLFNGNWAHVWPRSRPLSTVYARTAYWRYGSNWSSQAGFYLRWDMATTSGFLVLVDSLNQAFRVIHFLNGANVGESSVGMALRDPAFRDAEFILEASAVGGVVTGRMLNAAGVVVAERTLATTYTTAGRVGLLGVSELASFVAFRSLEISDGVALPVARDMALKTRRNRPLLITPDASAYGPWAIAPASLDLAPATPGNQASASPTGGTFARQPDGRVLFTPDSGFVGAVEVPYTVEDDSGTAEWPVISAPAMMRVDVVAAGFDTRPGPGRRIGRYLRGIEDSDQRRA